MTSRSPEAASVRFEKGTPLRGLKASDVFVPVLTQESVNRPWVRFELGAALGMGKRIAAIVADEVDPALLPQEIRRRKYVRQASPQETATELASATVSYN